MCILAQQEVTVAWTRVAVESRRQNWGQSQQNLLMCVGRFGVREKKQDRLFKSHLLWETFLWFHSYEVEELNVIPCSGSPATLHPILSFDGCGIKMQGSSLPSSPTTESQTASVGPCCRQGSPQALDLSLLRICKFSESWRGGRVNWCLRIGQGALPHWRPGVRQRHFHPCLSPFLFFLKFSPH